MAIERDIGDARVEIEEPIADAPVTVPDGPSRASHWLWFAAGGLVASFILLSMRQQLERVSTLPKKASSCRQSPRPWALRISIVLGRWAIDRVRGASQRASADLGTAPRGRGLAATDARCERASAAAVDAGFSRDRVFHSRCRRRRRNAMGSSGAWWSPAPHRVRNQWRRRESRRQTTRCLPARCRAHGAEHPDAGWLFGEPADHAATEFHLPQPQVVP